jgi:hypothetical protein
MVEPCIVNSSEYVWSETVWLFGCDNWARMNSAITPPARKKASEHSPKFRPMRL